MNRDVYVIKSGSVRAFHPVGGEEHVFWLGIDGDYVFSDSGITLQDESPDTFATIDYSVLYHFLYDDLMRLCQSRPEIFRWWNGIVQRELVKAVQRLSAFTSTNAAERYRHLLQESPLLLQRIPLIYIASYIGVTPQSLSRIRASLKSSVSGK